MRATIILLGLIFVSLPVASLSVGSDFSEPQWYSPRIITETPTQVSSSAVNENEVDPIILGGTIATDHLANWKIQSALYRECPQCVASQPYPQD